MDHRKTKELLVVFNTCGIKADNSDRYISHINSIIFQRQIDFDLVLSSNLNADQTRDRLENYYNNALSYCYTNENLPVLMTFNYAVRTAVEQFGEYDAYMFVDSGICFKNVDDIARLYKLFKSSNYAMVAGLPDNDAGVNTWFGAKDDTSIFDSESLVIPVGKTVNLHAQIFSNAIFQTFGRKILPDIFASTALNLYRVIFVQV